LTGNWDSVLRFEENKNGRDFVCGDIHGCFDEVEAELKRLEFNKSLDRFFCVGDLIDRGPKSELSIQYMKQDWFFTVLGNHEHMFLLGYMDSPDQYRYIENHIRNGGAWAYELPKEKVIALCDAFDKLPLIIQVGNTLITHAALPAVASLEAIEKDPFEYLDTVLWHREDYPPLIMPGINRVFVGHNIVDKPMRHGKIINLDTGAFLRYWRRDGNLTIIELKDEK